MGVHTAEVGLAFMMAALCVGAGLTVASISLIAKACVSTNRWSFEDISEELLHPALALWTGFLNAANCLGCAASYLIVCGQVFSVLTSCSDEVRRLFVVGIGVCVCAPMALAREVGFMRHLAALSFGAIILLVVCIAVWPVEHGIDDSVTMETLLEGRGGATAFTYMNSVNIMIFAYNNQFNVPQLTGELTPQPGVRRMTHVGIVSASFAFLLYGSVSLVGVLAFGLDDQKDTFVLDLAVDTRNPLVFTTLLAFLFSVVVCFQFHIFPIRQFCAYNLRKLRGLAADENEGSDKMVYGRSVTRWLDMCCGLGAVAFAVLIAAAITEVTVLLEFIGAFASAWISYVVPPLWVIMLRRRAQGFSWKSAEVAGCVAFFALGMCLFVFGTFSAIVG
jgi:amino acid permease